MQNRSLILGLNSLVPRNEMESIDFYEILKWIITVSVEDAFSNLMCNTIEVTVRGEKIRNSDSLERLLSGKLSEEAYSELYSTRHAVFRFLTEVITQQQIQMIEGESWLRIDYMLMNNNSVVISCSPSYK